MKNTHGVELIDGREFLCSKNGEGDSFSNTNRCVELLPPHRAGRELFVSTIFKPQKVQLNFQNQSLQVTSSGSNILFDLQVQPVILIDSKEYYIKSVSTRDVPVLFINYFSDDASSFIDNWSFSVYTQTSGFRNNFSDANNISRIGPFAAKDNQISNATNHLPFRELVQLVTQDSVSSIHNLYDFNYMNYNFPPQIPITFSMEYSVSLDAATSNPSNASINFYPTFDLAVTYYR